MKKSLSILLSLSLILTVFVFFVTSNSSIAYAAKNDTDEIYGSWMMGEDEHVLFQFNKDGTGVYTNCAEIEEFTYIYDRKTHNLEFPDSTTGVLANYNYVCYVCDNGMILSITDTGLNKDKDPQIFILRKL